MQLKYMCHRALMPESICITRKGDEFIAKLNNFSKIIKFSNRSSCTLEPSNRFKRTKDNEIYLSPQILNEKCFGLKSDVWSLGILLNYLLYLKTDNIKVGPSDVNISLPKSTPNWLK